MNIGDSLNVSPDTYREALIIFVFNDGNNLTKWSVFTTTQEMVTSAGRFEVGSYQSASYNSRIVASFSQLGTITLLAASINGVVRSGQDVFMRIYAR